jgi:hypothetical protein
MFQIPLPKPVSAFALAAMLLLIAGCANRGTVPATLSQQPSAVHQPVSKQILPARGGAFTATYSGTYSTHLFFCRGLFWAKVVYTDFSGSGQASFGLNQARGSLAHPYYCGDDSWGNATLYGPTRTDKIHVDMATSRLRWTWQVHRGTGKFARATGKGTAIFHLNAATQRFTADFTGTLHY